VHFVRAARVFSDQIRENSDWMVREIVLFKNVSVAGGRSIRDQHYRLVALTPLTGPVVLQQQPRLITPPRTRQPLTLCKISNPVTSAAVKFAIFSDLKVARDSFNHRTFSLLALKQFIKFRNRLAPKLTCTSMSLKQGTVSSVASENL
jgi:hypothetical protein